MTISRPRGLALESIAELDPVLWEAMQGERRRQHDNIELIASENYVSAAVMEAQGSWLTNKYAEGLPGKRYYGGCEFVDVAERLAQERALALFPGVQGGPLMQVIAAKAIALKLAAEEPFREDQRRTVLNAAVLAGTLADLGARVVSGGTDNHLMLVDVTPLGVTGKVAEHLLDQIGITVNKNGIPFDPLPPNTASGIRLGTPATTSRGFGEDEMRAVGRIIVEAIARRDDETVQRRLAADVADIVVRFPVPGLPAA